MATRMIRKLDNLFFKDTKRNWFISFSKRRSSIGMVQFLRNSTGRKTQRTKTISWEKYI